MNSEIVSLHMQENAWLIVSHNYTTLISSRDHIRQISSPIPFRTSFSVVTINSSSALRFGGRIGDKVDLNDLWQFSLPHRIWKKVKMMESAGSVPSPRHNHAAAVIGADMFVFGGYNVTDFLKFELWRYNVIKNSWSFLVPTKQLPYGYWDFYDCYFTTTAQTGMLWIASRCYTYTRPWDFDGNFELWLFIVRLRTWNIFVRQSINNMPNNYFYSSLDFWQRYL